jgi:putative heme-binding domain-containing protein
MPAGWPAIYETLIRSPMPEVRERAVALAVLFGDARAMATLRATLTNGQAPLARRQHALKTLSPKKDPALVPILQKLVSDRMMRGAAIRALAAYDDERTPRIILGQYAELADQEKGDAVGALASRPAYAVALLDAVERGLVPRRDLSAFTARQLAGLKDKQVADKLAKVWGTLRPASEEKAALMARYKALLTPDYLRSADRVHGRQVFAQTCASCHRLFGEGGDVGPELTGAQRHRLDYVLENMIDPSAIVATDYQVTILEIKDGRVLTAIIRQETPKTLTVQTQNERIVLLKDDIESRTQSPLSIMPEGLLSKLKDDEVRDLVAYLDSATQVPLPARGVSKPLRGK